MFKTVVLALTLLIAIPTLSASQPRKELFQWWNETGLKIDLLKKLDYFKHTTCYKNESSFRGCVAMINAAGLFPSPIDFQLVPTSLLSNPRLEVATIEQTFGAFTIVSLKKSENATLSVRQAFLKESETRKLLNAEYEKIRTVKAEPKKWRPVNFEALAEFMLSKVNTDPTKESHLAAEMMNAFLAEAVDAHTYILPIDQFRQRTGNADDSFYGLGCELDVLKGKLTVVAPLAGLPCSQAGIQPGDLITHIDGEATDGLSLTAAVNRIKGTSPSIVKLNIRRGDVEIPVKEITRTMVMINNVHSEIFDVEGLRIGYIRIGKFEDEQVCPKVAEQLMEIEKQSVEGYVLDIRGNPGGLVPSVVCVTGLFVGKKKVMDQRDPTTNAILRTETSPVLQRTQAPLTILINGASASASEILAGAIQDWKRGWVIGERSYGKGTVQTIRPWEDDEMYGSRRARLLEDISVSVWKAQTTARYHLPSGRTIQAFGVTPDFEVPFKADATDDERFVLRESELSQKILSSVGDPWKQQCPTAVQAISKCLEDARLAVKIPGVKAGMNDMMNDYQFRNAAEVLRCSKQIGEAATCGTLSAAAKPKGNASRKIINVPGTIIQW